MQSSSSTVAVRSTVPCPKHGPAAVTSTLATAKFPSSVPSGISAMMSSALNSIAPSALWMVKLTAVCGRRITSVSLDD